jgi:hypothetical protein
VVAFTSAVALVPGDEEDGGDAVDEQDAITTTSTTGNERQRAIGAAYDWNQGGDRDNTR